MRDNKILIISLIIFFSIYVYVASVLTSSSFVSILLMTLFIIISAYINFKNYRSKENAIIFILLFLLQLILLIYNAKFKNLPFTSIDWWNFDHFATLSISKSNNIFELYKNVPDLYTFFVAAFYKLFGSNINVFFFFSLPFAYIASNYIYKIVLLITNKAKKAELASLIYLLIPVNFIFSLSVLRETAIQAFAIISLYHVILYINKSKLRDCLLAFICICVAILMHSGMIGVLIVYVYVVMQKSKFKVLNFKAVFLCILAMAILSITPLWGTLIKRFEGVNSDNLATVMQEKNNILVANTSYIVELPNSFSGIILTIPYRTIMFALSPFPWQVYSFGTLFSWLMDGIIRAFIIYKFIVIIIAKKESTEDKKRIYLICMSLIATYIIFGLGTNNYGAAMRHRSKTLPFEMVLIFSYGVQMERKKGGTNYEIDKYNSANI